jgi:hypothetical protein
VIRSRKPEGDLLLQGGRCRLSWQQVIGKPASEPGFGRLVEGRDREVVEDCTAMPPPGAPYPVVAVKRVCTNTDLAGHQMAKTHSFAVTAPIPTMSSPTVTS